MSQPYQQPERFCLMQYQCEKCGHLEVIWNSRNAVTPFCVPCDLPECDGMKQHVNWQADRQWNSLPPPAGRVFVSITREDARDLAERKWEALSKRGDWPLPDQPRSEVLVDWAEHIYGDGSQPHVVSRGEYQRRQAREGQPS